MIYHGARASIFIACAIICSAARLAHAQNLTPILVAYAGQNQTVGPMWVGVERGTFRKYGLDVRMVQLRNGSLSMSTLATKHAARHSSSRAEESRAKAQRRKVLAGEKGFLCYKAFVFTTLTPTARSTQACGRVCQNSIERAGRGR
ncbi:MAG: hypothetical protein FJ145_25765 [Deltaproteobacteria bacterium]|nr:hypothetical protein [Deltaproteobacteria bacterium]